MARADGCGADDRDASTYRRRVVRRMMGLNGSNGSRNCFGLSPAQVRIDFCQITYAARERTVEPTARGIDDKLVGDAISLLILPKDGATGRHIDMIPPGTFLAGPI